MLFICTTVIDIGREKRGFMEELKKVAERSKTPLDFDKLELGMSSEVTTYDKDGRMARTLANFAVTKEDCEIAH